MLNCQILKKLIIENKNISNNEKLASSEINSIQSKEDKSKFESSKIIKKIAESLDIWQTNMKLK